MRKFWFVGINLFLLCNASLLWAQPLDVKKLNVVATFSILGDFVEQVAGDRVNLTVLVGPNGDAHTFEPTPQNMITLTKADLIFEQGLHFEHWLDDTYSSSVAKARRIVVTEGIEAISDGKSDDPHVWHDVSNAMVMVEHIKDALVLADPINREFYQTNAQRYLDELGQLNHWIIDSLKDISDNNRKLVTSHDTFGYFARRYGFEVIGAAINSATTEAADPSAAEITQLIEDIKAAGIRVVFMENIHNPKLLESIAEESGARLAPVLYTDALGEIGSSGDTYIKMMKHNVSIFAESLK